LFLKIWPTSSTKIATHGVFGRQKSKWQGFLNESTRKSSIWIITHPAIGGPPWLWKSQIGKPLNCIQGGSLTFLDPVKAALHSQSTLWNTQESPIFQGQKMPKT
jgi:hypothetical protein